MCCGVLLSFDQHLRVGRHEQLVESVHMYAHALFLNRGLQIPLAPPTRLLSRPRSRPLHSLLSSTLLDAMSRLAGLMGSSLSGLSMSRRRLGCSMDTSRR
jgi:hypothetical protein